MQPRNQAQYIQTQTNERKEKKNAHENNT